MGQTLPGPNKYKPKWNMVETRISCHTFGKEPENLGWWPIKNKDAPDMGDYETITTTKKVKPWPPSAVFDKDKVSRFQDHVIWQKRDIPATG